MQASNTPYPFKNLVFEGGGVKGIAYVGALQALEEAGILANINRVGGTSVGSINALLLAAGYSNSETLAILTALNFNKLKDGGCNPLVNTVRLLREYGWYKGDYFCRWLGDLLRQKTGSATVTFQALQAHSGKALYVYAANISTHLGEVYSPEHSPDMPVVDAVRRSMSLPLFFRAVRDKQQDIFVDGGILNNYPVKLFDREKYLDNTTLLRRTGYYDKANQYLPRNDSESHYIYNKETLGFRLDSSDEIAVFREGRAPEHAKVDNFLAFTLQLMKTGFSVQDSRHLHEDDWHRTIYIDSLGVDTKDFDISEEKKQALVVSGKQSTERYLQWWSDTSCDVAINHPTCRR